MAANRTLSELPITVTPAGADIIHNRQGLTDKSISLDKLSEYVTTNSPYSPLVVTITGNHIIAGVTRTQYIYATISSEATLTFPGSYGDGFELIIVNNPASTANITGTPNNKDIPPGEEMTFYWNGSSWEERIYKSINQKMLLGVGERMDVVQNADNPPTVKRYSRFRFINSSGNIINIAENAADRTFTWGSGDFPSISDGTWYLFCNGNENDLDNGIDTGNYGASKNAPTLDESKGGYYNTDGKVIASFVVTASVVSNVQPILYQFPFKYTFPQEDGNNGQVLVTNGSGSLSFQDVGTLTSILKTADYTILDADSENVFIMNPNTVSQYGTLTLTAPATGGNNTGQIYRVIHGSNDGVVKIDANGSQKFLFNGEDLQTITLYTSGQYIDFYWEVNLSKWIVIDRNIFMPIGYQNRSVWTTQQLGNAVTYDTKSAAVDLTGQVITFKDGTGDTGNTCTAVVIYDTAGTGSSGLLYFYNISGGLNIFPNNNTITASDGTTALVNETSGSNKNQNRNIYHGFNISYRKISKEFFISTDKTEGNILFSNNSYAVSEAGGNQQGFAYIGNDTNSLILQIASQGIRYVQSGGGTTILTGDIYYDETLQF